MKPRMARFFHILASAEGLFGAFQLGFMFALWAMHTAHPDLPKPHWASAGTIAGFMGLFGAFCCKQATKDGKETVALV